MSHSQTQYYSYYILVKNGGGNVCVRRTRLCRERRWRGAQVAHRKTQGDECFSGAYRRQAPRCEFLTPFFRTHARLQRALGYRYHAALRDLPDQQDLFKNSLLKSTKSQQIQMFPVYSNKYTNSEPPKLLSINRLIA